MADTAALVPPGSVASPIGESDPPFWYGGIYNITQRFTGGGADRSELSAAARSQLEAEGWRDTAIEEQPGATVLTATKRDLAVLYHAFGPPSTPNVEGIVEVRYRDEDEGGTVIAGGLMGGAAGLALATFRRRGPRATI